MPRLSTPPVTIKSGDECIFFSPIRDWDDFICVVLSVKGATAVVQDIMHMESYEVPVAALARYPFVGLPFGHLVGAGDSIDGAIVDCDCILLQLWGEDETRDEGS